LRTAEHALRGGGAVTYFARGSKHDVISDNDLRSGLFEAFGKLGKRGRILVVPPDITRLPSRAGRITELAWQFFGEAITDVLPATGTHFAMSEAEMSEMFGGVPHRLFRAHMWKENLDTLGRVPSEFIAEVSEGLLSYDWPAQVDHLLAAGGHDLILSIGQVVPHEVVGMAGYNKNILIGAGGREAIHKSHYLGAVYGMERMMGRSDTPVRKVLDYATGRFARGLPIVYVHTVVAREADGSLALKGLFVGDDAELFSRAAALSLEVNLTMVEQPLEKVVVYLDAAEYKSTWLGNKAIYRTRMAIADGGELIVLAPGVRSFGEDPGIDALIRRYGYLTTPRVLKAVEESKDLQENLAVAAHLIHGSSEERFTVTYCPGGLSREEVEKANFRYGELAAIMNRYDPGRLREGWNELPGGERIYFISKPAIGLWAHRGRFT
jgi:nickel-dependent lactate racemase